MTNFGLKVSKKGSSAHTDNIEELPIDPDHPSLKVFKSAGATVSCVDGVGGSNLPYVVITVPHNLGYVPIAMVYMEESPNSEERWLLTNVSPQLVGPAFFYTIDETNLTITRAGTYGGDGDYDLFYYIFYDQA